MNIIRKFQDHYHCMKGLRSKSPYSVQVRENTDQKILRIWTIFAQCKITQSSVTEKKKCEQNQEKINFLFTDRNDDIDSSPYEDQTDRLKMMIRSNFWILQIWR